MGVLNVSSEFEKWRKVKLKLLTPLRVGSGEKYPFFMIAKSEKDGNEYYRLTFKGFHNFFKPLNYGKVKIDRKLKDDEYLYKVCLKFNLDGNEREFEEVDEIIHHPNGGFYIPGSSLKGVLRLAFSQILYLKNKNVFEQRLDKDIRNYKKEFKVTNNYINSKFRAQEEYEHTRTKELHKDLFKFVIISDTNVVDKETEIWRSEVFKFINNNVTRKIGRSSLVEVIPKDTEFEFYMKIDHEELQNLIKYEKVSYEKELLDNFELEKIFDLLNDYYSKAIEDELKMLKDVKKGFVRNVNLDELIRFYETIKNKKYKIRIGDGGGLMFTSLFPLIDEERRKQIRNIIKNHNDMRAPLSRNYIVKGSEDFFTPVQMGWCEVRFD